MDPVCASCACTIRHPAHAVLAALGHDDVDAALELGLLDIAPCPGCDESCNQSAIAARDARRAALAARERHEARVVRLARRKAEREAARNPAPAITAAQRPALPASAADALARALAKASARRP